MDNEEKQITNEIDMECAAPDEDDTLELKLSNVRPETESEDSVTIQGNDGRDVVTKTGLILDFSDDYPEFDQSVEVKELEPLTAQLRDDGNINIQNLNLDNTDFSDYNQIDMECSAGDEDECSDSEDIHKAMSLAFEEEKPQTQNPNLLDKETLLKSIQDLIKAYNDISEKKIEILESNDGKVSPDYWKKLAKAHEKTQKKGARGYHVHLAGDPKAEMDMFNHEFSHGSSKTNGPVSGVLAGGSGVASTASASEAGLPSFGDMGGLGEALEETPTSKFKDLLQAMDYSVYKKDSSDGYVLRDDIYKNEAYDFNNIDELIQILLDNCDLYIYIEKSKDLQDLVDNHRNDIKLAELI